METSTPTPTPIKPGWKTTEFWGMAAVAAVGLLNQAFGWHIPTETIQTLAIAVAGYALSRGLAKKAAN
jgi:hypothetical protein